MQSTTSMGFLATFSIVDFRTFPLLHEYQQKLSGTKIKSGTIFFLALPVLSSSVAFALYSINLGISEASLIMNLPDRDTHIDILYTGLEQTFHLGLLCLAFHVLGLANSLRLNGIKSL